MQSDDAKSTDGVESDFAGRLSRPLDVLRDGAGPKCTRQLYPLGYSSDVANQSPATFL